MEVTQKRPAGNSFGRWASTRSGAVVIALISALIAAGILVYALEHYRQTTATPTQPATVLVAARLIEKGTSGAAIGVGQYFRIAHVLEKQVAPGALVSTAALHGKVAATDIYPGEQLTAGDFVGGGLFYSRLPPNTRAVSVPVDASHGMIGNVQTSDRVDVYASFPAQGSSPAFLRLVAPNVVVLDAGQLPAAGGLAAVANSTTTSNVVLEVNIRESAELAFSADYGKVWLVLRPPRGPSPSSNEIVSELSILAGTPPLSQEGK